MNRLLVPLIPAAIVGLVASGTGFRLPDAVLIAIAIWAIFVVFRSLMTVTSTIVAVCLLGALSQFNWYGAPAGAAYASSAPEASPGTFTHLARAVVHAVEDGVGIPHAPPNLAAPVQASAAPAAVDADPEVPGAPTRPMPLNAPSLAIVTGPVAGTKAANATDPAAARPPLAGPTPTTPMPTTPATLAPASGSATIGGATPPAAGQGAENSPLTIVSLPPVRRTLASASPATPPLLTFLGQPRVIDGATLSIDGHLIKLAGISTPDNATDCWRNNRPASCAGMATERLSQLIGTSRVTCRGPAQGAAIVAQCSTVMIDDLSRTMLDQGWAVISRDATPGYQAVASAARGNRRGFWQANFSRSEDIEPVIRGSRR